jgi:hypothetical protein
MKWADRRNIDQPYSFRETAYYLHHEDLWMFGLLNAKVAIK